MPYGSLRGGSWAGKIECSKMPHVPRRPPRTTPCRKIECSRMLHAPRRPLTVTPTRSKPNAGEQKRKTAKVRCPPEHEASSGRRKETKKPQTLDACHHRKQDASPGRQKWDIEPCPVPNHEHPTAPHQAKSGTLKPPLSQNQAKGIEDTNEQSLP